MYMVFLLLYILCALTCMGVIIASAWVAFSKARRPGWASIVPVYNVIVFLDIAGKPWWWVLIIFVAPFALYFLGFLLFMILLSFMVAMIFYGLGLVASVGGLVLSIMAAITFAKNYGFGIGFAIGLVLLPMVFLPYLAFGDAEYQPV